MKELKSQIIVKKPINTFKIAIIAIILMFVCSSISNTFAQSTVYFICNDSWVPVPVKINNQAAFDLKGTPKGNKYASFYSPCQKKVILYTEGKVIFSFDFERPNYSNPDLPFNHAGEIQLTLSENSVHYIQFKSKGWNDYIFEELSEKEGKKLLTKKKYILTPDYIGQKNKE